MKTLTLIAVLFIATLVKANEEPKAILVATATNGSVKIETNIKAKAYETFEIQKSVNNKTYTAVAIIMGTEDSESLPTLKISDKVTAKAKKITYRIVKVNADNTQTVLFSSILTL